MRTPERRHPRAWTRDPLVFGLALALLGVVTIALAVAGRVLNDPALIGLAIVSVVPAFWLFYQRSQALADPAPRDRRRRR